MRPPDRQRNYARQGDPDFQAFHHDLYRAVGRGRWWVMEQQPGPVNWAPYNPAPMPGMVRLWSWEAFAHGAEAVCYFRWRQAPMAQEQLHAGLLRPDSKDAPAMAEARQVARELADAPSVQHAQAPVALVFDYDADFAWATQPHGQGLSYFGLVFDTYKALRALGLSIDILPASNPDFDGYKLVLAPGLMHMPSALKTALARSSAQIVIGPRSGARDADMTIPVPLPPDMPGLDVTVAHIESLRPDAPRPLDGGGQVINYCETLEGAAAITVRTADGAAILMQTGNLAYLGAWLDQDGLKRMFREICATAGIKALDLPDGLRLRATGTERFWFNYNAHEVTFQNQSFPPAAVVREAT